MKKNVIEKFAALITAAFGLVAALAWNDTIKAIFVAVFGSSDTVIAMLIYSLVVTVIAVFATLQIAKAAERAN
jgi:hypothetical protein